MQDWVADVTGVVGALGTVAAVSIALWVALRDGRVQRAERADREAGQARLISTALRHEAGRWWVRTINDSTAPAFDCDVVEIRHAGGPSHLVDVPGAPVALRRLDPDEAIDRAAEAADLTDGVVVLRFVDAAGLRWRRVGGGKPERILD